MSVSHVAVITPFVGEPQEVVDRCVRSLAAQVCPGVLLSHVLVSDGAELPTLPPPSGALSEAIGMRMPKKSGDGGATPRAAGSAFAIGALGVDGLAFLDVDNIYTPDHIATVSEHAGSEHDVVSVRRWLTHLETGARMRIDLADSDGVEFTDPSCIFLANRGLWLGRMWGDPDPTNRYVHNTMQDRHFWGLVRAHVADERLAICTEATVEYRTPWLAHYPAQGSIRPPQRAKVMHKLPDGSMKSTWATVLERDGLDSWRVRIP